MASWITDYVKTMDAEAFLEYLRRVLPIDPTGIGYSGYSGYARSLMLGGM